MPKRGPAESQIWFGIIRKNEKNRFELEFHIKIGFPLGPLLAPLFNFVKYVSSAFSGKMNVVACLDRFLDCVCKKQIKLKNIQSSLVR